MAQDILSILRVLESPREAAAVVAIVRANLHHLSGGTTFAKVRQMIEDDDRAALKIWAEISKTSLAN